MTISLDFSKKDFLQTVNVAIINLPNKKATFSIDVRKIMTLKLKFLIEISYKSLKIFH